MKYLTVIIFFFVCGTISWGQNVSLPGSAGDGNSNDVIIGNNAGRSLNGGGNNVILGAYAGDDNQIGQGNVYIGAQAGAANTGHGNVFIGKRAGQNVSGFVSNKLYIQNSNDVTTPLIYGDFSAKKVGIGTNAPVFPLDVNGSIYARGWVRVSGSNGILFQNRGGGFRMTDNTWIRTYGNKSFYHNTGIMRTDGTFQVGPNGNRFVVNKTNGNVGIGTTTPENALDVNGTIRAKEIKVESGWSDYVFYDDYQVPTLEEEEKHIEENGYLLGFESEEDMQGEILIGDVSRRQQAKIEEMMLHLIEMDKAIKALQQSEKKLREENETLKVKLSEK